MASIQVNNAVWDELLWFTNHTQKSNGIFLLKTVAWDPTVDLQHTITCFTDASLCEMTFWFPEFNLGYQCHIPKDAESNHIFYYEALAVTSALLHDIGYMAPCMVVHTDNQNTINIWYSLKAHAWYNKLLIIAINKLIDQKIDVCVPGVTNIVSDTLSHFQIVMCGAGLQALSPLRPAHSSPSQTWPRQGLEVGLGWAWNFRSLSLGLRPGLWHPHFGLQSLNKMVSNSTKQCFWKFSLTFLSL